MFSFSKKRNIKDRLFGLRLKLKIQAKQSAERLYGLKDNAHFSLHRLKKLERSARYAAEDTGREARKMSKHTEAMLFSSIIALGVIMLLNAGNASFLNSLIALLLLVMVVLIYAQLKFQKRMLDQYIPRIDYVKVGDCQMFSERIRTVNLYGAKERMEEINAVRNIRIRYDAINTSFSPVSIQTASLSLKLMDGKVVSIPSAVSVMNVDPKRASSSEATFKLDRKVDFNSIEWMDLILKGNCDKTERLKPRLYVNILLRGKKPELLFEPFDKFRKRPEIASG